MIEVLTSKPFGRPSPEVTVADAIAGVRRIGVAAAKEGFVIGYGFKSVGCSGLPTNALADGSACGGQPGASPDAGAQPGAIALVGRSGGSTFEIPRIIGNGGSGASASATTLVSSLVGTRSRRSVWVVDDGTGDPLVYVGRVPTAVTTVAVSIVEQIKGLTINGESLPVPGGASTYTLASPLLIGRPVNLDIHYEVSAEGIVFDGFVRWSTDGGGTWVDHRFLEVTPVDGAPITLLAYCGMPDEFPIPRDQVEITFHAAAGPSATPPEGGIPLGRWSRLFAGDVPLCDPSGQLWSPDGYYYWALDGTTVRHFWAGWEGDVEIAADAFTLPDVPAGATLCALLEA